MKGPGFEKFIPPKPVGEDEVVDLSNCEAESFGPTLFLVIMCTLIWFAPQLVYLIVHHQVVSLLASP